MRDIGTTLGNHQICEKQEFTSQFPRTTRLVIPMDQFGSIIMEMFAIQSLLDVPYIFMSINKYCSPQWTYGRMRENITGKISQVTLCGFDILCLSYLLRCSESFRQSASLIKRSYLNVHTNASSNGADSLHCIL